jgi:hypothetical protein
MTLHELMTEQAALAVIHADHGELLTAVGILRALARAVEIHAEADDLAERISAPSDLERHR